VVEVKRDEHKKEGEFKKFEEKVKKEFDHGGDKIKKEFKKEFKKAEHSFESKSKDDHGFKSNYLLISPIYSLIASDRRESKVAN
jgi:hypothetical protein